MAEISLSGTYWSAAVTSSMRSWANKLGKALYSDVRDSITTTVSVLKNNRDDTFATSNRLSRSDFSCSQSSAELDGDRHNHLAAPVRIGNTVSETIADGNLPCQTCSAHVGLCHLR